MARPSLRSLLLLLPLLTACASTDTTPDCCQDGACTAEAESAEPAAPQAPADLAAPSAPEPPAATPLAPELFERVAILGASASAGFNLQLETGVPTRMADFLAEALLVEHTLVADGASELLFFNPERLGGEAVEGVLATDPTLVLAVDFPFWFLYGNGRTTADRLERLEGGLAMLDRFDCPIVVGTIPFMEAAAGGMIPHSSMPDADAYPLANARIAEWVAADERRALVHVDAFHETLTSGADFTVAGQLWVQSEHDTLLQLDHLHPSMVGTAIFLLQSLDALAADRGEVLEGTVLTDPEDLADAVDDRLAE